ncbi:hypothetical protein GN958_ATG04281 [Phytophthora infestans]|uniref:Uncharacterized protein n=1 Tax=Phytophthora infestans TaxID=4787 RepID=A0A8S9V7L3_PHYIN|nr:hypothetical protein GN958_ATG04281 [Phytophthora infestans]
MKQVTHASYVHRARLGVAAQKLMLRSPMDQDGYAEKKPIPSSVISHAHCANVTEPPTTLGLPPSYTQYEESHSDTSLPSSDQVGGRAPSSAVQEPQRKKAKRATQRPSSTNTAKATEIELPLHKASNFEATKITSDVVSAETMAGGTPKPKMVGMRKSTAISAGINPSEILSATHMSS